MTTAVGVLLSLSHHQALVLPTAVGVGAAETVGMAAGEWLSSSGSGVLGAAVIGVATGLGAIAPAVPYGITSGTAAVVASVLVALVLAGVVALARSGERGRWRALLETYGVLAAVALAVWLCQLITPGGAA